MEKRINIFYRLVEVFMLIIYIILIYYELLLIRKLFIFLIVILLIISFSMLIKIIEYNFEIWLKNFIENKEKEYIISVLKKYIKILLRISIIINPILYCIILLHVKLIYFFRWINYYLFNYLFIRKLIYYIIMNLIIKPILLIYYYFYKLVKRWKELTFVELVFRRAEGLILSILLISNIYNNIINYFEYKIIILFIYILFVVICLLEDMIFKYIDKEFRININNILNLRNETTLLFFLINKKLVIIANDSLLQFDEFIKEININNYFIWFNFLNKNLNLYKFFFRNMDDLEFFFKEIKYQPSFSIYIKLQFVFSNRKLGEYYYILINVNNYKEKEFIKNIYIQYKYFLKQVLFEIWDMEYYIGIDSYQYIKYVNDYYYLDINIEDYNYLNKENYRIEQKVKKEKYKELKDNFFFYSNLIWELNIFLKKYEKNLDDIKKKIKINFLFAEDEEFNKLMKIELESWLKECREEWIKKIK